MKTKSGFTLIELLVVVAIIGILAAVGLGQFHTAQKRGRDAQRKENLTSLSKALEMYYNDYERYPQGENGKIKIGANPVIGWGSEFSDDKGTIYMKQLPKDPADNFQYFYKPKDEGAMYTLHANLEHSQDQDIGGPYVGTDCQTDAGNQFCNYCIASSNESCD